VRIQLGREARALVTAVRTGLAEHAEPETAAQQQRYMKSTMPFRGLKAPLLRSVVRPLLAEHPLPDRPQWEETVRTLWDQAAYREERYAAEALAGDRRYRGYQDPDCLDLYEHLVVTGAWWDHVDVIAIHLIGPIQRSSRPALDATLRAWSTDPDLWRRRTALIHQVGAGQALDRQLLVDCILPNLEDREFFIRKAIGWALRALEAIILQVDEGAYQERERPAAAKREVKATLSENGLRTLIARGEAGDVAMMLASYGQVAEALADEGDEDPLPVRMSKAIGVIASPAHLVDLLTRHHGDPDPHRRPWEQAAAHQDDPTDPWAEDLPLAGWQTARHGNHHQPGFDDDEDCWDSQTPDEEPGLVDESPVDDADPCLVRPRARPARCGTCDEGDPRGGGRSREPAPVGMPRELAGGLPPAEVAGVDRHRTRSVPPDSDPPRPPHGPDPPGRTRCGPVTGRSDHRRAAAPLPRPDRREHHGAASDRSRRDGVRGCVRDPAANTAGDDDPAAPVGVPALTGHRPDGPGPHPTLAIGRATGSDRSGQSRPADAV
jgi:3-methyladenine DNA glycosylase AlkD